MKPTEHTRELVWSAAFAAAARYAPEAAFRDVPAGDGYAVERRELTAAERGEFCRREADRAVALLDAVMHAPTSAPRVPGEMGCAGGESETSTPRLRPESEHTP